MDELERRIRAGFARVTLPKAPEALYDRLDNLSRASSRPPLATVRLAVAMMLVITAGAGVSAFALHARLGDRPLTGPGANQVTPHIGDTVEGLPVVSVSDALAKQAKGSAGTDPIAVGGYWSFYDAAHTCPVSTQKFGALELHCHDGEFGITERNEPMMTVESFMTHRAAGPHFSPFVPDTLTNQLFAIPHVAGQSSPTVPIVAVGHFNDPLAAECQESERPTCANRFVLDRVVSLDVDGATPAVVAQTTPFPVADPPPAPFGPEKCAGKDVVYSFVGWTTLQKLGIDIEADPNVFAMTTADVEPIGLETHDPAKGGSFHWMGRVICFASASEPTVIYHNHVPGTAYKLWSDGRREVGEP